MPQWMVGIDTGGTFTDLIAVERETRADAPRQGAVVPGRSVASAVLTALDRLFAGGVEPGEVTLLVHGTTVATNALLEGEGARVGLLITRGFRAVYEARGWSQPQGQPICSTRFTRSRRSWCRSA